MSVADRGREEENCSEEIDRNREKGVEKKKEMKGE